MLLKVIEHSIVYWAIVLLLTAQPIKSQQAEFPVGVFTNLLPEDFINHQYPPQDHDKIKAMGVNSVIQFITQENRIQLQRYDNVIGLNTHFEDDYIARYASGYYSRWQAEEDVTLSENYPGVKHEFGYTGTDEWRSGTEPENIGKYLVTGPDYYQNRKHRFWPRDGDLIFYTVKFRMKIDGNAFGDEPVCKLEVVYYAPNGNHAVLEETTLTANDLSNTYEDIILTYTIPKTIGSYTFVDPSASPEGGNLPGSNSEYNGRQGVRFNVIWLGNRELFVDYIEVYDQLIGIEIAEDRSLVGQRCSTYAANYPHSQWQNLKYWYGLDELQTIDNFEPYRIVDSILNANGFPRLITTYYPEWDGLRDNEIDLKRFVLQAQPERVQYYYYPYNSTNSVSEMLEYQRYVMQQPWQHNFNIGDWYFVAQAFGYNPPGPAYNNWRKPTREEMRATVNLALAHGAKGMYFWNYYSYWTTENQDTLLDAIVDINETPTELYHEIRDNIAPRLKGKLGSTLLGLNYTGNYLQHRYFIPSENPPPPISFDYLTIGLNQSIHDMNWHVGFFENKNVTDDCKYFMLVNLLPNIQKTIQLKVTKPLTSYYNYRFQDVESENNFDISFANQTTQTFTFTAGEGRLYQVSPVVKYGGTLVGNDTITSNISLQDNMTINNNVTLFVKNSVYTIADTITLQGTGFISGDGFINITSGGKIIINSFQKGLFKAVSGVHPKLVWGRPPQFSSIEKYKIYRKIGEDQWAL